MNAPAPKRYVINSVDTLIRVLHADHRYALEFRNKAEQHITLKLRRKFFQASPDTVLDAFNTALMKFLQSKTFRDEALLDGQPVEGWTASELALGKLGGYLYRGSLNALIQSYRQTRSETSLAGDDADDERTTGGGVEEMADPSSINDPARAYEHMSVVRRMHDCINKLSDTLRVTMYLYLDELSMEQIARQQDLQVATVKSRLHAARKLVAECARKGMDDDHV